MGLVLDTSVLIADEKGTLDFAALLADFESSSPLISTITVSELLAGVERARHESHKAKRQKYLNQVLQDIPTRDFGLNEAQVHARLWTKLATKGQIIGAYDLLIAATAVCGSHQLATLNIREFERVEELEAIDASKYLRS